MILNFYIFSKSKPRIEKDHKDLLNLLPILLTPKNTFYKYKAN